MIVPGPLIELSAIKKSTKITSERKQKSSKKNPAK